MVRKYEDRVRLWYAKNGTKNLDNAETDCALDRRRRGDTSCGKEKLKFDQTGYGAGARRRHPHYLAFVPEPLRTTANTTNISEATPRRSRASRRRPTAGRSQTDHGPKRTDAEQSTSSFPPPRQSLHPHSHDPRQQRCICFLLFFSTARRENSFSLKPSNRAPLLENSNNRARAEHSERWPNDVVELCG